MALCLPGLTCFLDAWFCWVARAFPGFRANPSPYYRFCLCCGRKSHPVDELSLPRTELSHRKTALAGETPNRFCVFGSDFVVSRLLGGFFCHKKAETSDLGRKRSHSCSAGQAEKPDAKPRCGIPCLIWADGRSSCRASGGAACMQQLLGGARGSAGAEHRVGSLYAAAPGCGGRGSAGAECRRRSR